MKKNDDFYIVKLEPLVDNDYEVTEEDSELYSLMKHSYENSVVLRNIDTVYERQNDAKLRDEECPIEALKEEREEMNELLEENKSEMDKMKLTLEEIKNSVGKSEWFVDDDTIYNRKWKIN